MPSLSLCLRVYEKKLAKDGGSACKYTLHGQLHVENEGLKEDYEKVVQTRNQKVGAVQKAEGFGCTEWNDNLQVVPLERWMAILVLLQLGLALPRMCLSTTLHKWSRSMDSKGGFGFVGEYSSWKVALVELSLGAIAQK